MSRPVTLALILLAVAPLYSFGDGGNRSETTAGLPSRPIARAEITDPELRRLGDRLFRNPALGADGARACIDCHPIDYPAPGESPDLPPQRGRNPPTLLNVVHSHFFNWDGEHTELKAAVRDALLDANQMAGTPQRAEAAVAAHPELAVLFEQRFGHPPTFTDIVDVLTYYVETLVTPGAPFDRYLAGDPAALDRSARAGLDLFVDYGCIACHSGILLGGNLLQTSHSVDDYFSEHPEADSSDLGRFEVTGDEHDRYVFRVPSLRNVELTPPYFNDGSADTLELAIEEMGEHQIGVDLDDAEKTAIADFLRALTAPAWRFDR